MITTRATRVEFASSPFGRHLPGPHWLVWAAAPDLIGSVAWGAPRPAELEQAFAVWERLWPRLRSPLRLVTDVSRLTAVSSATYEALVAFVSARVDAMQHLATRHLVVVAQDATALVSGLGAGFLVSIRARHTFRAEVAPPDPTAAAAWLERPAITTILPTVDALVAEVRDADDFMLAVERAIEANITQPTVAVLSSVLGTSERSLQRRVALAGTSLRLLVAQSRCRLATQLLVDGDDKIAVVAKKVGFASASHFARVYRSYEGMSPEARRRG